MNIPLVQAIAILFAHFGADFFAQPRRIAKNKSTDTGMLLIHCGIYTFVIFWSILMIQVGGLRNGDFQLPMLAPSALYAAINGMTHFAIDAVTSRISKHFYMKAENLKTERRGMSPSEYENEIDDAMDHFWMTIAVDQFLHITILLGTLALIAY